MKGRNFQINCLPHRRDALAALSRLSLLIIKRLSKPSRVRSVQPRDSTVRSTPVAALSPQAGPGAGRRGGRRAPRTRA
eukprot:257950-Hanusia_phi.AAC.1